jgi:hypothetical protein
MNLVEVVPVERDAVLVHSSIFEDPTPGQELRGTLRDSVFVAYGRDVAEVLLNLAEALEKFASELRDASVKHL